MNKRVTSVLAAGAMLAALFSAAPVRAEEVKIPDEANINDPFGDGNYLNDQAAPHTVGDNVTPADASTVADLGKIWFAAGKSDLTLYIQTEKPLGTNAPAYLYDVYASPGSGSVGSSTIGCLRFTALYPGKAQGVDTTYQGPPAAKMLDRCNVGTSLWSNAQDGEIEILTAGDGSGIIKMTFPDRSFSPLLADGAVISGPAARAANLFGVAGTSASSSLNVDTTGRGTDFTIAPSGGGGGGTPTPTPTASPDPGKGDDPKSDCSKLKGKAKKKCKKGKGPKGEPKGCAKYVPGEEGAEAETFVVTDKHTEEAPLTVEFDGGRGTLGPLVTGVPVPPDGTTRTFHNVQVDTKGSEAGLYVRLDFTDRRDYDLYLNYPSGAEGTHSGDFNSSNGAPVFSCGTASTAPGCKSGSSYESVLGIRTADCQGWTTESVAYLTEGGKVKLSFWLGEATVDPKAPQ